MTKFKRFFSLLLVFSMILPGIVQGAPVEEVEVKRLAGGNRRVTSIAVSEKAYPNGADSVVLVGSTGEVDALTGTLLSSDKKAPTLLTYRDKLTSETKSEIKRLNPANVYILGGEKAVSKTVEKELEQDYKVTRIAGDNRFETAGEIAKKVKKNSEDAFIAVGEKNLADALAIGPVSAQKNIPVFLTKKDEVPKQTIMALKDLKVKNITIIGGEVAVSKKVQKKLEKDFKINRVYGNTREDTAIEIAKTYFDKPEHLIVAYGKRYADALVGGYLGAKVNAPILLANDKGLTKNTEDYIATNAVKTFVLGGEMVISKQTFNKIKDILNGRDTYEPTPDDSIITRGEWIRLLTKKFSIEPINDDESFEFFYSDSKNSKYGAIVETANLLGILPSDKKGLSTPKFEANKPATREFAAYTVAKIMGFEGKYKLNSTDASKVKYPSEVGVVVEQKFLQLQDGKFLPDNNLTGTDKNRIFDRIDYFENSLEIKESDFKDEVVFEDNVLEINNSNYIVVKNSNKTLTVTISKGAKTTNLKRDTVFVLPPSDDFISGIALKIVSVEEKDSNFVLICEIPEVEEVIKEVSFAGYGNIDPSKIETVDGVTVQDNSRIKTSYIQSKNGYHREDEGTLIGVNLATIKFGDSGISLEGDMEFTIPKITLITDMKKETFGKINVEELSLLMDNNIETKLSAKYNLGLQEGEFDKATNEILVGNGKIEICRVPIPIGSIGFSLDLIFFININIEGTISISYELDSTNGFQYKDGAFRYVNDYEANLTNIELNAEAKSGLGVGGKLAIWGIDLFGLDSHLGTGVSVDFKKRTGVDPSLYCSDTKIYLYTTMELDDDSYLFKIIKDKTKLEWSVQLYDSEKSPWNLYLHLENGKKVDICTYGKKEISFEEAFMLQLGDKIIHVKDDPDKIMKTFGEGKITTLEKNSYKYEKDGFIYTYIDSTIKYGINIDVVKPGIKNIRGLEVGMTEADMLKVYGNPEGFDNGKYTEYLINEWFFIPELGYDMLGGPHSIIVDNNTGKVKKYQYHLSIG